MAVAAPAQLGGQRFGPPERAFLGMGLVAALAVGAISFSIESSNPSVLSIYERLQDATYEELLPPEFMLKRFADSPPDGGWDSDSERRGVAIFSAPSRSHISYDVFSDPREAHAIFVAHRGSHVAYPFDPPGRQRAPDRYLGPSGIAASSFCVDLGWSAECMAVDGNVAITSLSLPTRAEIQSDKTDRTVQRAKLLLAAGLETLSDA